MINAVPVAAFKTSFGSESRQYLAGFDNIKLVQNLAFSTAEAALFPRMLASHRCINS
jgi:hypothetical protein